jgi:surfactin synthase thioesterase subunit
LVHEGIPEYAARMAEKIDRTQPFAIVGLSLGGIVGVEIAKRLSPACTVIIGSVPIARHLPPYYAYARKLRMHRLLPAAFYKAATMVKHLFSVKGGDNRRLMRQMIRDGNGAFILWGLNAVLDWKNDVIPKPLFHIHGTGDQVFPSRFTAPDYLIAGGHMLVMNQHKEINELLSNILRQVH